MSNKNFIGAILIVIFLGMVVFIGGNVVNNARYSSDNSSSSSLGAVASSATNSSSNTSAFASNLKAMSADEVVKDKMSSLKTDTKLAGSGDRVIKLGDNITVNYRGWLATDSKQIFDASFNRGDSGFSFTVGQGVITGWSQGVQGMKLGEVRRLKIPADLGYGSAGAPPTIPANADLIFDVELLKFNN